MTIFKAIGSFRRCSVPRVWKKKSGVWWLSALAALAKSKGASQMGKAAAGEDGELDTDNQQLTLGQLFGAINAAKGAEGAEGGGESGELEEAVAEQMKEPGKLGYGGEPTLSDPTWEDLAEQYKDIEQAPKIDWETLKGVSPTAEMIGSRNIGTTPLTTQGVRIPERIPQSVPIQQPIQQPIHQPAIPDTYKQAALAANQRQMELEQQLAATQQPATQQPPVSSPYAGVGMGAKAGFLGMPTDPDLPKTWAYYLAKRPGDIIMGKLGAPSAEEHTQSQQMQKYRKQLMKNKTFPDSLTKDLQLATQDLVGATEGEKILLYRRMLAKYGPQYDVEITKFFFPNRSSTGDLISAINALALSGQRLE